MKRLYITTLIVALTGGLFAQEAANKKVQAGLVAGFGINFQKMGTKLIDSDGIGNDLTIGANANFSLTETIGLNTGIEFDFETLKYKAGTTPIYYRYSDTDILQASEGASNNELYRMTTRKQKATYITIPTMLLFRTKFIGYVRYFGKFGLRNSVLVSNKINDTGVNYDFDVNPVGEELAGTITTEGNENMTAKNEMFIFKSAVGLAGGAEWNFTGSTCLVGEIGYYYGFTPLHTNRNVDQGKAYLFTTDALGTNTEYFSNKSTQGQLMLKVSILF